MGDYEDIKIGKESQFNEGVAKLIRIDCIKRKVYLAEELQLWDSYFTFIKQYRNELNERMDITEREMADTFEERGIKTKQCQNRVGQIVTLKNTKSLREYFLFLSDIQ